MPPEISMPLIRPASGTGYQDANQRLVITRPVRISPGDADARDGWEIDINDVTETSADRFALAMTKGYVSFSYVTTQSSAPPAGGPMPPLRAVFMLADEIHAGTARGQPRHQLSRVHGPDSLGNVSESFATLAYIEYENLDFTRTRQAILDLVTSARGRATQPDATWTLSTRHSLGSPNVLGRWLDRSTSNTPERYVDSLFAHRGLNQRVRDRAARTAASETAGFRLNAGEAFAVIARAADSPTTTPTFNCRVWIRFLDEATELVNPSYFFSALIKRRDAVTFIDDARFAAAVSGGTTPNKLGIPDLLAATVPPSVFFPPSPLDVRLHPLIWSLAVDPQQGVFGRNPSGALVPAAYPPFYVASAQAPVYHPDYDLHRIDLNATGLGAFHPNRRRLVTHGADFDADPLAIDNLDPADPSLLRGARYLWRIDDDGYLVYRTNGTPPLEDDWYPPFTSGNLSTVRQIWTDQGAAVSRFSAYFNIPCELFVGIAAKEGGSEGNTAVGIEPWVPPPRGYVSSSPWTDRAGLETVTPEEILAHHLDVPGIEYFLLTQAWNPAESRWEGGIPATRAGVQYVRDGHLDIRIRYGAVVREGSGRYRLDEVARDQIPEPVRSWSTEYTWEELLADMDHFGNLSATGTQPPEARARRPSSESSIPRERYRDSKRFVDTMDQRVSPGATQQIVAFIPTEAAMRRALEIANNTAEANRIMTELRGEGFFSQTHHYRGDTRDILDPSTPPSYRFLWLLDGAHTSFITFVRWTSARHELGTAQDGALHEDDDSADEGPAFTYNLENDSRDPVVIAAIHGGVGDLKSFNPAASFGIFLKGQGRRRWSSFPGKFNAAVHLFDQFDQFGAGGLALPSVRFAKRRA